MSNEIPTASRQLVAERDMGLCVRCGGMGAAWHHRRRRRVSDQHTHCACNGITLCLTCHDEVHHHPKAAKDVGGWIVSAYLTPLDKPVLHYLYQWVRLKCDGTIVLMSECAGCEQIKVVEDGLCLGCLRERVASGHASDVALARLVERERV